MPINPTGTLRPDNPFTGTQDTPQATVTVGPVSFDGPVLSYVESGNDEAIFTDYVISNRFEKDGHIYMMPIASPAPYIAQTAFVQLARPTLLWISDWTASRYNTQPIIPDPTPLDKRWILMDDHYEPAMVTISANGRIPLYRISGTYVYGCLNPSTVSTEDIIFGRPPWLADIFDRSMPRVLLQQNLINRLGRPRAGK